jgi:hypothetical protein
MEAAGGGVSPATPRPRSAAIAAGATRAPVVQSMQLAATRKTSAAIRSPSVIVVETSPLAEVPEQVRGRPQRDKVSEPQPTGPHSSLAGDTERQVPETA